MKTIKIMGLVAAVAITSPSFAGQDRSGGDPSNITKASLTLLLQDGSLKRAMLNYLHTLSVPQIDSSYDDGKVVTEAFARMLKDSALQSDILTPDNYVIGPQCFDSLAQDVPAATDIGELGGKICFNLDKLAERYKELSAEQMMIDLASLAFHEHVHHFQDKRENSRVNEREAYLISAYVQITAKIVQIPLLKWTNPKPQGPGCEQIYKDKIAANQPEITRLGKNIRNLNMAVISTAVVGAIAAGQSHMAGFAAANASADGIAKALSFTTGAIPGAGFAGIGAKISVSTYESGWETKKLELEEPTHTLQLLREADIGGGAMIEQATPWMVAQTKRNDVSPFLIASTIQWFNSAGEFCKDTNSLDSRETIFKKVAEELKK